MPSEYTYGYNIYKESYPERMKRAKKEEEEEENKKSDYPPHAIEPYIADKSDIDYDDDFYEGYIKIRSMDGVLQGHIVPDKKRELANIKEQLKNYPTPVSDSDEQFNHLLEERDRLQKEILL